MLPRDDCRDLLKILLSTGADFAELYEERVERTGLVLDDADLDTTLAGSDGGIALRLVRGERTFFSNSNDTDPAGLRETARRLAATLDGRGRPAPTRFREPEIPTPSPIAISPATVPAQRKVEIVQRADRAARSADARVLQVTARYLDTVQEIQIANSHGELGWDTRVICTLAVQALAREGENIRTGYAATSETRGFELFEAHPPEGTARRAARLALLQLSARPAPAGSFTVVLSSQAGGTMVHEACGHGLEGDFAEKGLSVYTGRVGQEVASPLISVVDDGTLPHGRGSARIDDEGVPCSRVTLIDRGVLKGFLHSRRSARRTRVQPTGNGRRESFRHLPIPRMRNTLIAPGQTPPEEILASVSHGIFVAHMGGGEVDIASGNFVFNCSEAYLIRDGRLAEPLRDVTLAGCGPEILRTIDMVGSDLGFEVGTCGKDGQGVPVADAQPTLRIPSILVGGQVAGS
jgi:TldD protein